MVMASDASSIAVWGLVSAYLSELTTLWCMALSSALSLELCAAAAFAYFNLWRSQLVELDL